MLGILLLDLVRVPVGVDILTPFCCSCCWGWCCCCCGWCCCCSSCCSPCSTTGGGRLLTFAPINCDINSWKSKQIVFRLFIIQVRETNVKDRTNDHAGCLSPLTCVNVSASMAAPALLRSSTLVHFSSPAWGWAGPAGPPPPTREPWPAWGVSLPPAGWPPFRVLLRTLPLKHTEIVRDSFNSFMSVWKLQKLEKSWTWTLSWALRHEWLIRGCLLAAQACRVSVSHSDCYFQTVTANKKSTTLEVNQ